MEVFGRSGCTSCQKAEAFLNEHGATYDRRDLFKASLDVTELRSLLTKYRLGPNDILSTRSRPYRDLNLAEQTLSDDQLIELMSRYPALIRRPLVTTEDELVIGFDRAALERLVSGT